MAPASFLVESQGYHILASTFATPGLEAERFAGGGVEAIQRWADAHPDVLVAYILAVADSVRWLYDPSHKAEALALIAKEYHADTPALAEQIYEVAVGQRLFSEDLCTPRSAEAGSIKAAVAVGAIPPGSYPPERYAPNVWVERATHHHCR